MTYISVWLFQSVGMFVWARWFSSTPMSIEEFAAGIWFSAWALATHWACFREMRKKP